MQPIAFAGLAFALIASYAAPLRAQTACADLGGNIIYGVGGSTHAPLLGQIASRLRDPADAAVQLTIVYAQPGDCFAYSAFDPEKTEEERRIAATPTGTSASYWDQGSGIARACVLADDVLADFGVALDLSLCPDARELPDDLGAFDGPVSTLNAIVPTASTQRSISAEAIYFLLAFGDAAEIEPWNDERYLIRRGASSGLMAAIAKAIGFSGEFVHGFDAPNTVATVASSGVHSANSEVEAVTEPNADATLGFVSGENAANASDRVRTLAYQHFDQACGYWPDSSATAFDKLNVRAGRYALWLSAHFYAPLDQDDDIANPDVAKLIGYVTRPEAAPPDLPLLDLYIDAYNVPHCAMQVSREEPFGALSSFQPEQPCGCYFEKRATGLSSCATCGEDDDCPSDAPACRLGFCEAQ